MIEQKKNTAYRSQNKKGMMESWRERTVHIYLVSPVHPVGMSFDRIYWIDKI
jgi:hypothetical protein